MWDTEIRWLFLSFRFGPSLSATRLYISYFFCISADQPCFTFTIIQHCWWCALFVYWWKYRPCERTTLLQLIDTDNKNLNKVLTVLAALCSEMELLWHEAEERFYSALLYYDEGGMGSFLVVFFVISFTSSMSLVIHLGLLHKSIWCELQFLHSWCIGLWHQHCLASTYSFFSQDKHVFVLTCQ